MKRKVRVILIGEADNGFKKLDEIVNKQIKEGKENTHEMSLLRSIKKKSDLIKINPFYGNNIEKRKIPKYYNASNLWRVELSRYWRMLYTIKGNQIEIICFVLEIIDHERYNKLFGYRKK